MNCLPSFASFCVSYFQSDTGCDPNANVLIAMRFLLLLITKNCYLINSVYPMAQSCKCIILIFNTARLIVILNCHVGGRGNINLSSFVSEGFSVFEIVIGQLLCKLELCLINM